MQPDIAINREPWITAECARCGRELNSPKHPGKRSYCGKCGKLFGAWLKAIDWKLKTYIFAYELPKGGATAKPKVAAVPIRI